MSDGLEESHQDHNHSFDQDVNKSDVSSTIKI